MNNIKLAIACDHGGYDLKKEIIAYDGKQIPLCAVGAEPRHGLH